MYFDDYVDKMETEKLVLNSMNSKQNEFIVINEILRERKIYSFNQEQSKSSFEFKWNKRDTYETEALQKKVQIWFLEKYFDGNEVEMNRTIFEGCKFLEVGCGAGNSALNLLGKELLNKIHYLGADISNAVDMAKLRFEERGVVGEFIQCDLNNLPFEVPTFDFILAEGVLHHTDSTERAIKTLSQLLVKDGKFLFYVYSKKAPIREFNDDFIRDYFKDKTDEETWEELIPLTKLGQTLGELELEIDIPEDIPYLGIKKGKVDLQRFFYYQIFKAYYDKNMGVPEMNHINFDWYRPLNCQRQTPEEVKKWCEEAGLLVERFHVEESGITVVARKK